ncbi:MAG: hypothetical protein ACI9OJ_000861 [Myxococcota bacterium]|jgi:hypothetical protein
MPYPKIKHRILDDEHLPLDAHFGVVAESDRLVVTLESRSGSPTANPRNLAYAAGLELLLARLQIIGAVIADIRVDSTRTKDFTADECRLRGDITFPLPLAEVGDVRELRRRITAAQRAAGHPAGREPKRKGAGAWKRIAIWLDLLSSSTLTESALLDILAFNPESWIPTGDLPDGTLDRPTAGTRRVEQPRLRKVIFGKDDRTACDLCGRILPVELLVAAHIKRRTDCNEDERRDLQSIAMSACLLGCDVLYERGWVAVKDDGIIIVHAATREVEDLSDLVDLLEGRRCPRHSRDTEAYFDWHRKNRFRVSDEAAP